MSRILLDHRNEQQKAAYPDIVPMILTMLAAKAFGLAVTTAKAMPDWHIIAVDPQAGRIEATQASFWFGFVDDMTRDGGEGEDHTVRFTTDGQVISFGTTPGATYRITNEEEA